MAVGPEPVEGGAPPVEPGDPGEVPVEDPQEAGFGDDQVYHLHLRVSRGEDEGGESVAEDAWNFDAGGDDEAVMVAAQLLAETFGAQGGVPPEAAAGPPPGGPAMPGEPMGAGPTPEEMQAAGGAVPPGI